MQASTKCQERRDSIAGNERLDSIKGNERLNSIKGNERLDGIKGNERLSSIKGNERLGIVWGQVSKLEAEHAAARGELAHLKAQSRLRASVALFLQ